MTRRSIVLLMAAGVSLSSAGWASDSATPAAQPAKYLLRYRFQPGQTLRWEVLHQASVRTSIGGNAQTVDTVTRSDKVWRVKDVDSKGLATFDHSVENVEMRRSSPGGATVRYNSRTDQKPPPGFEQAAKSVGKTLVTVQLDGQGKVVKRERHDGAAAGPSSQDAQMTIPLPEEAVPVGHTWSFPYEINVPGSNGIPKKIRLAQRFTLEEVKTDVATIRLVTQILTPVSDPAMEAKLVQYQSAGTVRFDVDAGQILSQQVDIDRHVVGFRGEVSSLHYLTRFTENLQKSPAKVAAKEEKQAAR